MFNFSKEKIKSLKFSSFPATYGIFEGTIKSSGTDTIFDLNLNVIDLSNNLLIFNNEQNKKFLKIKIFEINNEEMKNNILNDVKTIDDLNFYIKNNDCQYKDISCSSYEIKKITSSDKNLSYFCSLIFKEQEKKYLKLGIVFYYDLNLFSSETKIPISSLKKEILIGKIKIENILDIEGKVEHPNIKKIINTKKIFVSNLSLNNFYDIINLAGNQTRKLTEKTKNLDNSKYFSNPLFSRDRNANLNFIFDLNYKKLVSDYSNFNKINNFFRQTLSFKEISKINFIKIIKREYVSGKKNGKMPVLKNFNIKTVIDAEGNSAESLVLINEKSTKDGKIREIKINDFYHTYEVIDREIYNGKNNGHYEYGVLIDFEDNFYDFLKDLRDVTSYDSKIFDIYLSETNKFYYDNKVNAFKEEFYDIFNTNFKIKIIEAISRLITTLKSVNVISVNDIREQELINSMITMLMPESATSDNIILCKNIFTKTINFLEKILKDNSFSRHQIEYWFKNDLIDSSVDNSIGYSFLKRNSDNIGMLSVTNLEFETRISDMIFEYTNNNSLKPEEEKYKFTFLSPYFIESQNVTLGPIEDTLNINDIAFIDLNTDIKSLLLTKDISLLDKTCESSKTPQEIDIILKSESILNNYSCVITNLYEKKSENSLKGKYSTTSELKLDDSVDATFLYVGLLKTMFKTSANENLYEDSKYDVVPFQIKALNESRDKFFTFKAVVNTSNNNPDVLDTIQTQEIKYIKSKKRNYLNSLGSMSRYLFLYNSIHAVEILTEVEPNNIKSGRWQLLTSEIYNSLPQNSKTICRLNLFSNHSINNFSEIQLPIFDKYFILEKNYNEQEVLNNLLARQQTYQTYAKQKEEQIYYDQETGRLITSEDGLSEYFEEDLSTKTLIKEYKKSIAYENRYRSSFFSPQRLEAEAIRRAGSRPAVESLYFKTPKLPYKNLFSPTNREALSNISDSQLSRLYYFQLELSSTDKKDIAFFDISFRRSRGEQRISFSASRFEIVDELLRRFGYDWKNTARNIIAAEELEKIKKRRNNLKEKEKSFFQNKNLEDFTRKTFNIYTRYFTNSYNDEMLEEYLNFILLINLGDKFYYPPFSSKISEFNKKDIEKYFINKFGNWKSHLFQIKYFGTNLINFLQIRREHYEDLISFRKSYYEEQIKIVNTRYALLHTDRFKNDFFNQEEEKNYIASRNNFFNRKIKRDVKTVSTKNTNSSVKYTKSLYE